MKNLFIIFSFFLSSCSESQRPSSYPNFFSYYIDFTSKADLGDGDVDYTLELYKDESGELRVYGLGGEISWTTMPIMSEKIKNEARIPEKYERLFGPVTVAVNNANVKYEGGSLSYDRYWLFRFKDGRTDTLRAEIHKVVEEGYVTVDRYILYYNGLAVTSYNVIPEMINNPDNLKGPHFFFQDGTSVSGSTHPLIISASK